MPSAISLNTPIEDLHRFKIARLGPNLSRKLAAAVASHSYRDKAASATVEDLLNYLPMRYEDRSHLTTIKDLEDGVEASLELQSRIAGGYEVRNRRSFSKSRLYIFEVSAVDLGRTGKPVVVWWFVSGRNAHEIINYYSKKLERGTRFITYGCWNWDSRRGTFSLRLNKPADELEILPTASNNSHSSESTDDQADDDDHTDPALAAVHAGRRVPVYRKLGDFNSKRLREIIHGALELLPDSEIPESLPSELLRQAKLIGRSQA
ncbi:MAG TPA: hypothetical protein VF251_03620, partial [Pyrinomonadaceae bacterium]